MKKDYYGLQEEIEITETKRASGIDITTQIKLTYYISLYNEKSLPAILFSSSVNNIITGNRTEISSEVKEIFMQKITQKDFNKMSDKALQYAVNVINILTTQVDREYYTNPDRDVRLYADNHGVKKEDREHNQKMIIKVFGETKKIALDYNREKQKHGGVIDATHVIGHWRHYKSERYTHKRGEVEWIKPFYKGKDRELQSKMIKIVSAKK